jgi:carbonic anhydrase
MTPAEILRHLKEGNFRFLNGLRLHRDPLDDIQQTRDKQWPFAAIVACMDSRVSTEMVFDLGIGDMFSLRMAGNVVTDGILGSLEYAAGVVGSRLIVVLGHSNCGAIRGACDHFSLGHLTPLLEMIQPSVGWVSSRLGLPHDSSNPEFVQQVAETHVRLAASQIAERSEVIRGLVDEGKLGIVGAMYDVRTGKVRFFE